MSSQLVDTDRRRLRVTRVEVLKNRSQSRQPAKKTPSLTSRRQLRVELPHFHNEIFPDSPAPTWQGFQKRSPLGKVLRQQNRDPDSRVSTGRRRLRVTRVAIPAVLDPRLPDVAAPPRCIPKNLREDERSLMSYWLSFIVRVMEPIKVKVLNGMLALLVYSTIWLSSPDMTRLRDDPASRWTSIDECYINGTGLYWDNFAEFLWIWFKMEAGLMDNEPRPKK